MVFFLKTEYFFLVRQAFASPYDAQAYFLYEPFFPCSDLMVLNHTVCHCEYCFNSVVFTMCFLMNIVTNLNNNCLGQFPPNILPHFCG